MKDIPVFTTEYGVASLVLKEIPARGIAYVKLLSSAQPAELLGECIAFCRACGAEEVFASGDDCLKDYPCAAVLVQMRCSREALPETDAAVFPMTEETAEKWRAIYNERMAQVPNAAYMTKQDERAYLQDGDCYFVHRNGVLLGIGKASGDQIEMVASVAAGGGKDVVLAMAALLSGDTVSLVVARENHRAVALYERLGFHMCREVSRWYKIL